MLSLLCSFLIPISVLCFGYIALVSSVEIVCSLAYLTPFSIIPESFLCDKTLKKEKHYLAINLCMCECDNSNYF